MAAEHDAWREQASLYALGALTAAERVAFETHLASCASCVADVRALSGVADALARAVPQTDPPSELRTRVLASTSDDLSVASGFSRTTRGAVPQVRLKSDATTMTYRPWLAAAASLLLAVALGAYAVQLRGRVSTLEARLREAMLRADASERQIADARRAAAAAESQVAVLAAPDLTRIDLAGQPVSPQASARAYWSRSRGLVFTASNLPALPPGRVYQLWVLPAQPLPPISAGLLKPDASGRANVIFDTPVDLPKPAAMAVTIEPDGGVPAPTGDKYLVGLAP
jgi:anti-sigma-K factor RskA